ncbi:MAG: hypothetical protein FJY67_11720, partial [Calditrichaeota bacterium]|nr:hypothetical protein [Calditrichota bacterium]
MKYSLRNLIILAATTLIGIADAQPRIRWVRTYDAGDGLNDSFNSIRECENGDYILAGSAGTNDNRRAWLARIETNGGVVWSRLYEQDNTRLGSLYSAVECDGGGFVAVGQVYPEEGGAQLLMVRVDSDGELMWVCNAGGERAEYGYAVIELKSGEFLAAGETSSIGNGSTDGYLVMVNRVGEVVWERAYGGERVDLFTDLRERPEGGAIAIGTTFVQDNDSDIWIVRVDSEGEVVWQRTYGQENLEEKGYRMASFNNGMRYAVCGKVGRIRGDWVLLLIDGNGNRQHMSIYDFGGQFRPYRPYGILAYPDGGTLMVGQVHTDGQPQGPRVAALRLEPGGDVAWTQVERLDDFDERPNYVNSWFGAAISRNGSALICGNTSRIITGNDGVVMVLHPESSPPEIIDWYPWDLDLRLLLSERMRFTIRAVDIQDDPISYGFLLNGEPVAEDSTLELMFEEIGDFVITGFASDGQQADSVNWLLQVRNLLIMARRPDTLSLTVQRNSEIDFAIDSVAYIGDSENLRYEWMIYDSTAVRWEEVGGDDRIGIRSYAFNRTGGYALKAKVFDPNVDPVPADSVQWAIQVRGVIRA